MFHASTFKPQPSFFPYCSENNDFLVLKVKGRGNEISLSLWVEDGLRKIRRWEGWKISSLPTAVTRSSSCGSRYMALRGAGWSHPGARLWRGRARLFLRAPLELWARARAPAALEENSHLLLGKARMGPRATLPSLPPPPPVLHTAPARSANSQGSCFRHEHINL